ncbi:MAG: hypothetical protein NZ583_08940, partial [Desulfobacterota bacterium]|nr:hypothetical protein [Thermodesulfobacteriota bacterium]
MRKLLIVLAILIIPAISFAGAVTTRYDATIGGYIKAEFGYSDQLRGQSGQLPYREPMPGFKHYGEDYGTYFSTAVQTRINFLVKGPDLKGFKTQAFLEGDFYAPTAQGEFRLRHARIELLGKDVIYTIGQTSQVFGSIYGTSQVLLVTVPWFSAAMPVGGARMPQINAEYTYKKDFKFLVGAFINNSIVGPTGTGDIDSYTMAQPYLHGRIMYTTDKCGRIGRDQLTFMATAFYGREKRVSKTATPPFGSPSLETVHPRFYDKKIDSWGVHGNLFVPVIPAKKDDKTGSVGFSIFGFTMQNPGDQGIPTPIWTLYAHGRVSVPNSQAPYMRKDGSYGAPVISGWGPQAYVYLTDKLLFSAS